MRRLFGEGVDLWLWIRAWRELEGVPGVGGGGGIPVNSEIRGCSRFMRVKLTPAVNLIYLFSQLKRPSTFSPTPPKPPAFKHLSKILHLPPKPQFTSNYSKNRRFTLARRSQHKNFPIALNSMLLQI